MRIGSSNAQAVHARAAKQSDSRKRPQAPACVDAAGQTIGAIARSLSLQRPARASVIMHIAGGDISLHRNVDASSMRHHGKLL
jgi:uncharacterized protein YgbK (DUF1537 family)